MQNYFSGQWCSTSNLFENNVIIVLSFQKFIQLTSYLLPIPPPDINFFQIHAFHTLSTSLSISFFSFSSFFPFSFSSFFLSSFLERLSWSSYSGPQLLQSSHHIFLDVPWAKVVGLCYINWKPAPQGQLISGMLFVCDVSLIRDENYTLLWS